MSVLIGETEYFKGIGKIAHEGPQSRNPLAFRWYDEKRVVAGKSMKDYLRFAVAYWHSFCGTGQDPFGDATHDPAWKQPADPAARARGQVFMVRPWAGTGSQEQPGI